MIYTNIHLQYNWPLFKKSQSESYLYFIDKHCILQHTYLKLYSSMIVKQKNEKY